MPKQKKKKSPGPTSAFGDTSGFGDFPAFGDWPGDVAQQAGGGGFEDFGKSAAAADAELEHDAGRAAVANALRAESMSSELAGLRASLKSLTQVNEKLKAELQRKQQQVRTARQKVARDEHLLGSQEDLLSDIRKQIFEEKNRILNAEDSLKVENIEAATVQAQLEEVKALDYATQLGLEQMQRIEMHMHQEKGETTPYDVEFHKFRIKEPAHVAQGDELVSAKRIAQRSLSRNGPIVLDNARSSGPLVRRAPMEVWQRTRRVRGETNALVAKRPPATGDESMSTNANFKRLLTERRGPLYQDHAVVIDMAVSTAVRQARPGIYFELGLQNVLNSTLHAVHLVTDEGNEVTALQADGSSGSDLRPKQRRRFRGSVEVLRCFAEPPQVQLSYSVHDGSRHYARLKLPLAVTRFLTPTAMDAGSFLQFWNAPLMSEVAFVCTTSADSGGDVILSLVRRLQLGGGTSWLQGITECPEVNAFASQYPIEEGSSEVLIVAEVSSHSEFRSRSPDEFVPCRLAVRSKSDALNQALARTLLLLLSDE